MLNYTRCGEHEDEWAALRVNIEESLWFSYFHGRNFYDRHRDKINEFLAKNCQSICVNTWDNQDQRFKEICGLN
jgi:hypothetical protein